MNKFDRLVRYVTYTRTTDRIRSRNKFHFRSEYRTCFYFWMGLFSCFGCLPSTRDFLLYYSNAFIQLCGVVTQSRSHHRCRGQRGSTSSSALSSSPCSTSPASSLALLPPSLPSFSCTRLATSSARRASRRSVHEWMHRYSSFHARALPPRTSSSHHCRCASGVVEAKGT